MTSAEPDAVVVGGGFYGCCLALWLCQERRLRVVVIEREHRLMRRASYGNQARVHMGYHYPRSFVTAYRSRMNYGRFLDRYADCIHGQFTTLYAVAARRSMVSARQYERFAASVGIPLRAVPDTLMRLFDRDRIEAAWLVREVAFDADKLADSMWQRMADAEIETLLGHRVTDIQAAGGRALVQVECPDGGVLEYAPRLVFNCTYAGLRSLPGCEGTSSTLRYEIAEIALVRVPEELRELGVTVMDGPFFSCMPFPARGLHSLSHVRYTPHLTWTSSQAPDLEPYRVLDVYDKTSRVSHMIHDAARYMPAMRQVEPVDSIFEVKVVLQGNDINDGRPILLEQAPAIPGAYAILGGKLDNIFDVIAVLQEELAG